jgi:hypothetical protein
MHRFVYLPTSSADTDAKAGVPVQRAACEAYAPRARLTVLGEFADYDVTGTIQRQRAAARKAHVGSPTGRWYQVRSGLRH